jgi:hypothetical protein
MAMAGAINGYSDGCMETRQVWLWPPFEGSARLAYQLERLRAGIGCSANLIRCLADTSRVPLKTGMCERIEHSQECLRA